MATIHIGSSSGLEIHVPEHTNACRRTKTVTHKSGEADFRINVGQIMITREEDAMDIILRDVECQLSGRSSHGEEHCTRRDFVREDRRQQKYGYQLEALAV